MTTRRWVSLLSEYLRDAELDCGIVRSFLLRIGKAEGRDGGGSIESHRRCCGQDTPCCARLWWLQEMGGSGAVGLNPETLFASGYSGCFMGALQFVAKRDGVKLPDNVYASCPPWVTRPPPPPVPVPVCEHLCVWMFDVVSHKVLSCIACCGFQECERASEHRPREHWFRPRDALGYHDAGTCRDDSWCA